VQSKLVNMLYRGLGQAFVLILVTIFSCCMLGHEVEGGCVKPGIQSCAVCTTSDTQCDQCNPMFGLDAGKKCASCKAAIPNCFLCTSTSPAQCTKCASFNYTVAPDGTCQSCGPNCKRCTTNGPGNCDDGNCNSGYVLDGKMSCQACQTDNCAICSSDLNTCTYCKAGYYLTTASPPTCVECDKFCTFCQANPPICNPGFCQTGYGFNTASEKCQPDHNDRLN